jgi:hypothetical protein
VRADLLAGGHEQRGVVGLGVEDGAHRVAEAGGGVQVDVTDGAARLGVAVRHPDRDGLLQAEHVAEVIGVVGEHRQLGRSGIAEHRRHPVSSQQLVGRLADRAHRLILSPSSPLIDRAATLSVGRRSDLHYLSRTFMCGPSRLPSASVPVT